MANLKHLGIFAISAIVVMTICALDTRKYIAQLQKDPVSKLSKQLADISKATTADLVVTTPCIAEMGPFSEGKPLPKSFRNCLMAALPQIKTFEGVYSTAPLAGRWLLENPNDIELKAAATKAIDAGWIEMEERLQVLGKIRDLTDAHNSSVILRAIYGIKQPPTLSDEYSLKLERAEVSIEAPALAEKFMERRMQYVRHVANRVTNLSAKENP